MRETELAGFFEAAIVIPKEPPRRRRKSAPPPRLPQPSVIPEAGAATLPVEAPPHPPLVAPAAPAPERAIPSPEFLRRCAWEIGESRSAAAGVPAENHAGLVAVGPTQGFAHWRILQPWVDGVARARGPAWQHCRLVLRLYDVTCIVFNGFNAHRVLDVPLHALCGEQFIALPRPGTSQIAEAGFLLRNGEFVPAARSQAVQFAPNAVSPRTDHTALLVNERRQVEKVGNLWEQGRILSERRKPKVRQPLRVAVLALEARLADAPAGALANFVTDLSGAQAALGHEVHVFLPASVELKTARSAGGVQFHPLNIGTRSGPIETAHAYARALGETLRHHPPFDLFHVHEWLAGLAACLSEHPAVLSLTSTEGTRLNGAQPGELSLEIQRTEREVAHALECILTPAWLQPRAVAEFGVPDTKVHPFCMDGHVASEWAAPLDAGQVKRACGLGPLDRLLLFVGPLEPAAGPDILLEALPTLLGRAPALKFGFVGLGGLRGEMERRAAELGVAHAARFFGHMEDPHFTRLLRASEALMLPSRQRFDRDDLIVALARRAGRPVITTHGGPAHLVRHEENGLVTYDNPGSMVWACDRLLGDPAHAENLGRNGRRGMPEDDAGASWPRAAARFFEICAAHFPELCEKA